MRLLTSFIFSLLLITSTHSFAETVLTKTVDGGNHFSCFAHLHADFNAEKSTHPIYFMQFGSGPTLGPSAALNHTAYFLFIDKPGLTRDPSHPDTPIIDKNQFLHYTSDTLTTCADNALQWADALTHQKNKIFFYGHSEGALIVTRLLEKQIRFYPNVSERIGGLFLSGIPMDRIETIFNYQMPPDLKKRFWDAYRQKDSEALFEMDGQGYEWYETAFSKSALSILLESLLEYKSYRTLPVEFFQGMNDHGVPAQSVMDFETANNNHTQNQHFGLNLHARYYNADHMLNDAANADIMAKLDSLSVTEPRAAPIA